MLLDRTAIGKKLRLIRMDKKISQERLAQEVGKTRATINAWETGSTPIPDYAIELCARALNIQVSEITEQKNDSQDVNEDFYTLIKVLAGEDPNLILQFKRLSQHAHKLSPKDKTFLTTLFKTALNQVEVEDETDTF